MAGTLAHPHVIHGARAAGMQSPGAAAFPQPQWSAPSSPWDATHEAKVAFDFSPPAEDTDDFGAFGVPSAPPPSPAGFFSTPGPSAVPGAGAFGLQLPYGQPSPAFQQGYGAMAGQVPPPFVPSQPVQFAQFGGQQQPTQQFYGVPQQSFGGVPAQPHGAMHSPFQLPFQTEFGDFGACPSVPPASVPQGVSRDCAIDDDLFGGGGVEQPELSLAPPLVPAPERSVAPASSPVLAGERNPAFQMYPADAFAPSVSLSGFAAVPAVAAPGEAAFPPPAPAARDTFGGFEFSAPAATSAGQVTPSAFDFRARARSSDDFGDFGSAPEMPTPPPPAPTPPAPPAQQGVSKDSALQGDLFSDPMAAQQPELSLGVQAPAALVSPADDGFGAFGVGEAPATPAFDFRPIADAPSHPAAAELGSTPSPFAFGPTLSTTPPTPMFNMGGASAFAPAPATPGAFGGFDFSAPAGGAGTIGRETPATPLFLTALEVPPASAALRGTSAFDFSAPPEDSWAPAPSSQLGSVGLLATRTPEPEPEAVPAVSFGSSVLQPPLPSAPAAAISPLRQPLFDFGEPPAPQGLILGSGPAGMFEEASMPSPFAPAAIFPPATSALGGAGLSSFPVLGVVSPSPLSPTPFSFEPAPPVGAPAALLSASPAFSFDAPEAVGNNDGYGGFGGFEGGSAGIAAHSGGAASPPQPSTDSPSLRPADLFGAASPSPLRNDGLAIRGFEFPGPTLGGSILLPQMATPDMGAFAAPAPAVPAFSKPSGVLDLGLFGDEVEAPDPELTLILGAGAGAHAPAQEGALDTDGRRAFAAAWAALAAAAADHVAAGTAAWEAATAGGEGRAFARDPRGRDFLAAVGVAFWLLSVLAVAAQRCAHWAKGDEACADSFGSLSASMAAARLQWGAVVPNPSAPQALGAACIDAALDVGLPLQRLLASAETDEQGGVPCGLTFASLGAHGGVAVQPWGSLGRVFAPAANLWLHKVAREPPILPPAPNNMTG